MSRFAGAFKGLADLVKPVLAESGWEWLARHRGEVLVLLLAGLAAVLAARWSASQAGRGISIGAGLVFVAIAFALVLSAATTSRGSSAVLEYAAPVVAADGVVSGHDLIAFAREIFDVVANLQREEDVNDKN